MADKITFPTDWSHMTDAGIIENIKFIAKNRRKYPVSIVDNVSVRIGDVNIVFYDIMQTNAIVNVAKVNGKIIRSDKNPELYRIIKGLYDTCVRDRDSLSTRLKNHVHSNKETLTKLMLTGVVIASIIGIEFIVANAEIERQAKIKQEKIEFARELLQDYEYERSKNTTVNIDSLINQHIR